MSDSDEIVLLRVHPRPSQPITLMIPEDVLPAISEVAAARDMSVDALLRLYVGQGLRFDAIEFGVALPHLLRPNATTRRALEDAKEGRGLASFPDVSALFEDLSRDD